MPGTGMSLAKFMALALWLILAIYVLSLVFGFAYRRFPNPITQALYRVVTAS